MALVRAAIYPIFGMPSMQSVAGYKMLALARGLPSNVYNDVYIHTIFCVEGLCKRAGKHC